MHETDEWEDDARELTLPTARQVAAALAAAALVGPAALGGMPVLPVTADDERRRQQEELQQESSSSVGTRQSVDEAAAALSLSQRRLAAVTREVEGTHAHDIAEADVVSAAGRVARGQTSPRLGRAFRAALGSVAVDSVDLFILLDDERRWQEQEAWAEGESSEDDDENWDDWDEGWPED